MPFRMKKKTQHVVAPPPDDIEAEESEVEEKLRGKTKTVVKSSSDKVR
jgi:hypothetical protein